MGELDPVSQAILDYIQNRPGYIAFFKMIREVNKKTGEIHTQKWYFRRLCALALEGYIEANVQRSRHQMPIMFRRLPENGLEELLQMEV